MLNRNPTFKSILILGLIFFMITGDLAAKMISISPLSIKPGRGKQRFSTIFDLTNKTIRPQTLSALIVFKNNRVKWWRGVTLPVLKSKSKQKYYLQFNSRLILAMDFDAIYVLIYDENYQVFIDSSSKHGIIKSDVIYNGDVKLKLYDEATIKKPKIFILGEKKTVIETLKASKRSNATVLSELEATRIADQEDIFIQTPVGMIAIKSSDFKKDEEKRILKPSKIMVKEEKIIEPPEFIEEEDGVKIDVDRVFAYYFAYQTNPMLTYQTANSDAELDFIKVSIAKPEQLNIVEQEKIVSLYVDNGQNEKAIVFLSDQLTMAPEKVDTYINLSNVYLASGDKNSALEVLNSSLANISFSKRMAVNQELTERSKQAASQKDIKEAEFLSKQFSIIGQSFLDEGKYFEALRAFESLQTFNPDYPGLDAKINFCREKIREVELQKMMAGLELEKARAREKSMESKVSEPEAEGFADATADVSQLEVVEAAPVIVASLITRRGIADESGVPDPEKMIDFYIENGETDKAEFFLKEQIGSDPGNLKTVLKLVHLYQQEAKLQEANELMEDTLSNLPENARSSIATELESADTIQLELSDVTLLAREYENQGVVYFNDKDCTNAHPLFQNLLQFVPGYPGLAPRIATCEEALGINQKLALKETTKAVLTADVIKANGQILLTGIPRFSNIYLFRQGNLVQHEQVELSQYKAELEPGEYSLFIQSFGYADYQSNITIAGQTLLNENVSLIAIDRNPVGQDVKESGKKKVEGREAAATKMHHSGW